jgi:hypothetical protein
MVARSLTIGKVRYKPPHTWVTHDARIELPGKIEFGFQEIIEKAGIWPYAIALLDLYSISRPEFEHPTTSSRARARLRRGRETRDSIRMLGGVSSVKSQSVATKHRAKAHLVRHGAGRGTWYALS